MKKTFASLLLYALGITILSGLLSNGVSAADLSRFNPSYIISDEIFYDSNAMSYESIKQFIASKVPVCDTNGTAIYSGSTTRAQRGTLRGYPPPYTCLKDYRQTTSYKPADAYCHGFGVNENVTSSEIIYNVSKSCGINPKVLLVLLQKEQGLITDDWPWSLQYRSATGMGCPDTSDCDAKYYGFFNQVYGAARQFKKYQAHPEEYNYLAQRNNYIKWHPDFDSGRRTSDGRIIWEDRCGGSTIFLQNQATAGLYNYTPFRPNDAALRAGYGEGDGCSAYGNRNFWLYFNDWFATSTGDRCSTDITASKTDVIFRKEKGRPSTGNFLISSGTSTGCIEFHAWNQGFGSWSDHISTNSSSINTEDSSIMFADLDGDGKDEAVLVAMKNTGSGMVEFHVWDSSLRRWRDHIISNSSTINPTVSSIAFLDTNGDGKDEGILIGQGNGSTSTGKIEFHIWNQGFGTWRDHIVSNSSTLDPQLSSIRFADTDGDGKDEGILIGQGNGSTSTGKIEFHIWNQGFGTWRDHRVSNSSTLDPAVTVIRFADTEGDGKDEGVLIGRRPPTGSGNIEFHIWNQGFGTWRDHIVSNQPTPAD